MNITLTFIEQKQVRPYLPGSSIERLDYMINMRRIGALLALTSLLTFAQPHSAEAALWSSFRSTASSWLSRYQPRVTAPRTSSTAAPRTTTTTSVAPATEQTLVNLVNAERNKAGIAPLQLDSQAAGAAQIKAKEMASRNYFSHTSPTYGSVESLLRSFGVRFSLAGENIGQGAAPEQIHAMWLNSSSHRANMLNRKFTHIGVGVARSGSGYVISQIFVAR